MSLLPAMILYLTVGCGEWYLALRRTLACARGEKVVLVCIVFFENLLGLWVLSNFIRTNNWFLALSYSAGASAGALLVAMRGDENTAAPRRAPARSRRRAKLRPASRIIRVLESAARLPVRRLYLSIRRSFAHVWHPG
ncbi:MAG: hypothetical protein FJ280_13585 [Planctomycetes bacterium]|nr:hypothetical protein [Planctomycetota bacterium]